MSRTAPVLLCVAAAASAAGQGAVFSGRSVEDLWAAGPGLLAVQSGARVHLFTAAADGGWHEAPPPPDGPPRPERGGLAGADFFDVGASGWVVVRRAAARSVGGTAGSWRLPAPLLREPHGGWPLRLPLLLGDGRLMLPARPGFVLASAAGTTELPIRLDGALNLGYGLGDYLEVHTRLPWILRRGEELVVGGRGRWRLLALGGAGPRSLEPPPFDDEEGLLDIPFAVPPRLADLVGGAGDDLVVSDASSGAVAIYGDLDAPRPAPTRIVLVGGPVLATWTPDLDADGRRDLVVLRAPRLNPLVQLDIVRSRSIDAELLVYRGRGDEPLPRSPDVRRALTLPLRIGVRNGLREVRMPVAVAPAAPMKALLVGQGAVRVLDVRGSAEARALATPWSAEDLAEAVEPFGGVGLPGGRVAVAVRSARGSEPRARVVILGPF